jgi:hypothetical protein
MQAPSFDGRVIGSQLTALDDQWVPPLPWTNCDPNWVATCVILTIVQPQEASEVGRALA